MKGYVHIDSKFFLCYFEGTHVWQIAGNPVTLQTQRALHTQYYRSANLLYLLVSQAFPTWFPENSKCDRNREILT
jgi:hypothetical protein